MLYLNYSNKLGEAKYHKAYYVLKHCKIPKCRYKLAEICIKLNKYTEAEKALLCDKTSHNVNSKEVELVIPNGASGYYLLGLICERSVNYLYLYNLF